MPTIDDINDIASNYPHGHLFIYKAIENKAGRHALQWQLTTKGDPGSWFRFVNPGGFHDTLDEAIAAEYEDLEERMAMNIFGTSLFPYLEGQMLKDAGMITMTMTDVAMVDMANQRQSAQKPVVYFQERKKGLILNKTNAKVIAGLYGPETNDWRGKRVSLYAERGEWFGKAGWAVRVADEIPANGKSQATPRPPVTVDDLEFGDEEPPQQLFDENGHAFTVGDDGRYHDSDTPGPHYDPKLREKALGTRKLETFAEAAAEYMNDGRTGQDVIEWLTGRDDYEYDRANNAETLDAMQGAAAMHDKAEEA
jgi:hypothetical protein